MHTQIHRRQEITLDQLHLLRGRDRGRDRGRKEGAGIFIDPISTKNFISHSWVVPLLAGWCTHEQGMSHTHIDTHTAAECEGSCIKDALQWWTQFRETAFKGGSTHTLPLVLSFVLLSSQTEPVQPTDIYLCVYVCVVVCECVCPVFFILQSGPLLLGNAAGLEPGKKNSDKDITLSLLLSPSTSHPSNSLFTFFLIFGSRMRDWGIKIQTELFVRRCLHVRHGSYVGQKLPRLMSHSACWFSEPEKFKSNPLSFPCSSLVKCLREFKRSNVRILQGIFRTRAWATAEQAQDALEGLQGPEQSWGFLAQLITTTTTRPLPHPAVTI